MPMRATTVRFGEDLWTLLEREAEKQGISSAQFVRDATIMRVAFLVAQRGDAESRTSIEDIAAAAVRQREADGADAGDPPPVSLGDPGRLSALRATGLLDAPADETLDRLTGLATRVLNAPIALVSLVDRDRQFFASCVGLAEPWRSRRETPLSHSFCQHAVEARRPLVVNDAREDPLLRDNLAIRDLGVIAYLGIPLITADGEALGTLCVIDHKPRTWTSDQVQIVEDLAASVLTEITLRAHLLDAEDGDVDAPDTESPPAAA
jgi:GAF domain-containing protein